MITETVIISPSKDDIEIKIDIDEKNRTIKISSPEDHCFFHMDEDPYPMRGPLYWYVYNISQRNKYQMMKILYVVNKYRGLWDKYVLF